MHSWYVLYAEGRHLELQPYDDRETAMATAFALLRAARHVIEVGPVRGPMDAVIEATELRRMLAEEAAALPGVNGRLALVTVPGRR